MDLFGLERIKVGIEIAYLGFSEIFLKFLNSRFSAKSDFVLLKTMKFVSLRIMSWNFDFVISIYEAEPI